jgi:hypothetical protein
MLADGKPVVLIQFATFLGVIALFATPDEAKAIGAELSRIGNQSSSGLLLPR